MKRIIVLICILFLVINLITFMPNTSYGICNTFNFSKEVNAVQLILANGNILYNLKVDKDTQTPTQGVPANSYKNLNLVFIIENENQIYQNRKSILTFIDKVYQLYGNFSDKISIAIIPFNEYGADNSYNIENLYKSNKQEVVNEINNFNNYNLSLEGALKIAVQGDLKGNKGRSKKRRISTTNNIDYRWHTKSTTNYKFQQNFENFR